jgi:uncharacterized protein YcfL
MKKFTTACLFFAACLLIGCDSAESRVIVDPSDKTAMEQYEQAIQDANNAMAESANTPVPEVGPEKKYR